MSQTKTAEVVYLNHSGFAVDTGNHVLVFDYYKDESQGLSPMLMKHKKIWIFSSHAHHDHFNPAVGQWQEQVKKYVFSQDIQAVPSVKSINQDKVLYMPPYEQLQYEGVRVTTYGSTDEGVSFLVEADGWKVFHAGDLNWWHWKGDTPENIQEAERLFRKEMQHLEGVRADIAFFPVDSRLEDCRTMGIEFFCRTVPVQQLITMHAFGEVWQPQGPFPKEGAAIPLWCPKVPGERRTVEIPL